MTTSLIILAAGMSSRMKKSQHTALLSSEELTQANQRSKGLITLGSSGRPLLDYILSNAQKAGITEVYIVTGENNTMFKEHYGAKSAKNAYHGLSVNYAIQYIPKDREKPLGTADAVFQTIAQYPQLQTSSFLVCNSDNLYSENAFGALVNTPSLNAMIAYNMSSLQFTQERLRNFAILNLNADDTLVNIVEKPKEQELITYKTAQRDLYVSMNIFKFNGGQFYKYLRDCPLHSERNEKELPVALGHMIADKPDAMRAIKLSEHVPDLTSKSDISSMKNYIKNFDFNHWS